MYSPPFYFRQNNIQLRAMASTDEELPKFEFQCLCKTRDDCKLRRYIDRKDELIGTFCTVCSSEYLRHDYVISGKDETNEKDTNEKTQFLPKPTPSLDKNTAYQVQSSTTPIDLKRFADEIKIGDHITWQRKVGYWHHAIVEDVEETMLKLIQWNKNTENRRIEIMRDCLKVETQEDGFYSKTYRIDYPEEITKLNNTELVLARAKSRLGDTGYGPFTDNCESFATYCKTGVEQSHQVAWLKGKVNELITHNVVTTARTVVKATCTIVQKTASVAKQTLPTLIQEAPSAAGGIFPAEGIEYAVKGSNWVGAGIVLVIEGGFVAWDLSKAYKERKDGKTTRNNFIETAIRRVVEGLMSAGLSVLFSLGPELIGIAVGAPLGPAGIIVGGIIGGVVGGVVGKVVGTALGSFIGKVISSSFKADDRAVTDISELESGDHIVVYSWLLHPRCHAIVVEHDGINKIKVIRNRYSVGVVEEWIPFSKPLFRVEYKQGTCKDAANVVETARSMIGERKYSLALYNCKSFARQCKSSLPLEPDDEPWQLINHEDIPDEALQKPCLEESVSNENVAP